jgi:hypothetical protein
LIIHKIIIYQIPSFFKQLSVRTRAQLISDSFSLAESGLINGGFAFDIAKYLSNEFDFLPWNVFISRIKFFIDLFDTTPSFGSMQSLLSHIVEPYYTKLGWVENIITDSYTDRYLQLQCFFK